MFSGHPMKPHRVRMTHNLIVNYGLYRKMDCFRPKLVSAAQLTRFHSDDYINFLRLISPGKASWYLVFCLCMYTCISTSFRIKTTLLQITWATTFDSCKGSMLAKIVQFSTDCSTSARYTHRGQQVRVHYLCNNVSCTYLFYVCKYVCMYVCIYE